MRRFLWATPLLFVVISSPARADSFSIYLTPNSGNGDNFGVEQQSGGMTVFLGGGTQTGFFDDFPYGYPPGSTSGGSGTVYLDFGFAQFGGNGYQLNVSTGSIFISSFTLPTNGASTVTLPVTISFNAFATTDTGQGIFVGGSSSGDITFMLGYTGDYYAVGTFTVTTPEPGTVGLIGTGLIGIFSLTRNRLRIFTRLHPPRGIKISA